MNRFVKLIIIPCLTAALIFAGCTGNDVTDDRTTPWTESGGVERTPSAEKETYSQPETFAPKEHEFQRYECRNGDVPSRKISWDRYRDLPQTLR